MPLVGFIALLRFLAFVLGQATVAVAVAATLWAAGSIVSRARARDGTPVPWALTMALGFALITQILLLAGMAGLLRMPIVLALAIGIHLAALPAWRRVVAMRAPGARGGGLVVIAAAVAALPAFLLTLYPPLGFDQTMYHLPYARAFAASGGVPFVPALRYPIFPQLAEVLNAAVLMFAGDVATQITGWLALVACVGLAYAWARELAAGSPASVASGWLAAGMIVGSPIALYLAASGYVEPLLALFITASLYAADRARLADDARWWLVAAGVLAGSAASVKYLGLYFVPMAAILIVRRAPWRVLLRDLAIYGVAAAAALLPSYGRLIAETGNPLFPFYPQLFGANAWASEMLLGPRGKDRWLVVMTRLWDVTFRRELVGNLPPFSPAFVAAAPIIAYGAWRYERLRRPLLVAVGYLLAAPIHAHYLFAIGPLWSTLAGASTAMWLRRRPFGLIAVAVIIASGGEAYAVYRLHRLGLPPVTSEGRDRLLASQIPLYPAVAWLNRTAGPVTLYVVHGEFMVDYVSGTMRGDFNGAASFTRVEDVIRSTGSVAAALDTVGASHLLVPASETSWNAQASRDPQLTRIYEDGQATLYRRR